VDRTAVVDEGLRVSGLGHRPETPGADRRGSGPDQGGIQREPNQVPAHHVQAERTHLDHMPYE
jgi:hypothetical protein